MGGALQWIERQPLRAPAIANITHYVYSSLRVKFTADQTASTYVLIRLVTVLKSELSFFSR